MKKTLTKILWMVILLAVVIVAFWANKKYSVNNAGNISIIINSKNDNYLVTEEDIRRELSLLPDTSLLGLRPEAYRMVESQLERNLMAGRVDIYKGLSGRLTVEVTPKTPIARVIDQKGRHFYLNETCDVFPTRGKPARVLVISGNIPRYSFGNPYSMAVSLVKFNIGLSGIKRILHYINNDPLFSKLIDQIYINKRGEFELIPKIGRFYIEFGTIENMEEKFENLKAFFNYGPGGKNIGKYQKINLKFKNQVICTKH